MVFLLSGFGHISLSIEEVGCLKTPGSICTKSLNKKVLYPNKDQKRCIQTMQKSLEIDFLFLIDSVGNNSTIPAKVCKEGKHGDLPLSYCDIQTPNPSTGKRMRKAEGRSGLSHLLSTISQEDVIRYNVRRCILLVLPRMKVPCLSARHDVLEN